ncbi:MAG: NAD(+) synthase [Candidatus Azobacteroides sp.]|nr:NAD(+) synthase [Candidatus Azobacteroides sp.]
MFGFVKVAVATPQVKVADCRFNIRQLNELVHQAAGQGVQIICFPELCITGYTCGDLFFQQSLLKEAENALNDLIESVKELPIAVIAGMPVISNNRIFNAAVLFQEGKILAAVPKIHLPNYNEFYEKRWFSSGADADEPEIVLCNQKAPFGKVLLQSEEVCIGIEICEDLWQPVPPSSMMALHGANLLFNLSASNEIVEKNNYRRSLIIQQSARCVAGYLYVSSGIGESSTDLVFSGSGFICENGSLLKESNRFSSENELTVSEIDIERLNSDRRKNDSFVCHFSDTSDYRMIRFQLPNPETFSLTRKTAPFPFVPSGGNLDERCDEIFAIQTSGLIKRLQHTGIRKVVLGISGGLDSTLALLVCVKAFDKLNIPHDQIIGITMPGFGTTDRTYNNAISLMKSLRTQILEIDIKAACLQHFKDIGHDPDIHDVTYENTQARERTQILMDIANKEGGLVIGTGDLSEIALGWCTYNGDHISMYAVNASIPKTLIRHLIHRTAENQTDESVRNILSDILHTPVSPELLPAGANGKIVQKTEDVIGPYELHDFFLYYFVRRGFSPKKIFFLAEQAFGAKYDKKTLLKWLQTFFKRFFSQQFKRSCFTDGPKVGSVSLSPRGDWRMPSDASVELWLKEMEEIKNE